jgi:hypothetical protein
MERKYKINLGDYGGIYSKFMILLQYIEKNNLNIDDCYLNITDCNFLNENNFNTLDYVLMQSFNESYEDITANFYVTYSKFNPIQESVEYNNLKNIIKGLQYKKKLLDLVEKYVKKFKINSNTIGVHIRLCDMNIYHKEDFGYLGYDDFLTVILQELKKENNIFVASDNRESIEKLKKEFKNKLHYVPDILRGNFETEDTVNLQLNNIKSEKFWIDTFLDMILLSNCGTLIHRTSNLANASIISSSSLKKIITL